MEFVMKQQPNTLANPEWADAGCACAKVRLRIKFPARWAWHDHSPLSRLHHAAAYATYVGSWRKRLEWLAGEDELTAFRNDAEGTTRSFCRHCGTPVLYERDKSPHMVNIPRALFLADRVGREPRYHGSYAKRAEWTYEGEPVRPLKNYPSFMIEPPSKKRGRRRQALQEPEF